MAEFIVVPDQMLATRCTVCGSDDAQCKVLTNPIWTMPVVRVCSEKCERAFRHSMRREHIAAVDPRYEKLESQRRESQRRAKRRR